MDFGLSCVLALDIRAVFHCHEDSVLNYALKRAIGALSIRGPLSDYNYRHRSSGSTGTPPPGYPLAGAGPLGICLNQGVARLKESQVNGKPDFCFVINRYSCGGWRGFLSVN